MEAEELRNLRERAHTGDFEAGLALGVHYSGEGRPEEARKWLEPAANSGHPAAMRTLGRLYLVNSGMPVIDGIRLTMEAAKKGDAEALHQVAVFAACGAGIPLDWETAFEALRRAAAGGHSLAQAQLDLLSRFDLATLISAPVTHRVVQSPRVFAVDGLLPAEFCDWLIERARPRMGTARTYDHRAPDGLVSNDRNNRFTDFNIAQADLVIAIARARMAAATGLAAAGFEHTAILHYSVGQQFTRHYDFLDPDVPAFRHDIAQQGQRVATVLVYLNEGYGGAETEFPLVNFRHKGGKGDALFFFNVDASGQPDRSTLHAGLPPSTGEKWLLSQFIRARGP